MIDALAATGEAGWPVYVAALLLMAVPLGPAEPTMLAGGTLAGGAGMDLGLLVLALGIGGLLGDLVVFALSRGVAPTVTRRWVARRGGTRVLEGNSGLISAVPLVSRRRRDLAIVLARFVPGARSPTAALAGAGSVSPLRYAALSASGVSLWVLTYTSV